MTENRYDAIVVGARCAGSPTAMMLARSVYRVLLVHRATSPSDTISTHLVHPPGVAALQRWGLLEQLTATAVLDKLLMDAASEAGAEVREGFIVSGVVCASSRLRWRATNRPATDTSCRAASGNRVADCSAKRSRSIGAIRCTFAGFESSSRQRSPLPLH